MFALEFSALLDGLSIQVALDDPEVDSDLAYDIAMQFAERELNLPPAKKRLNGRSGPLRSAERAELSATGSAIGTRRAAMQHPHRVVRADAADPFARVRGSPSPGPAWLAHLDDQRGGRADVDVHLRAVAEIDHLRHDAANDVAPRSDRLAGVLQR